MASLCQQWEQCWSWKYGTRGQREDSSVEPQIIPLPPPVVVVDAVAGGQIG